MALEDALLSYWKLEEASGDRVDARGIKDLVETNGSVGSVAGKLNDGADLTTALPTLRIPKAELAGHDADTFSMSFWFKVDLLTTRPITLTFSSVTGWQIGTGGTGLIQFKGNPAHWTITSAGGVLTLGSTHHVVVIRTNSGPAELWVDGVLVASTPTSGTSDFSTELGAVDDFTIGANANNDFRHDGFFDEVGFWTRALSSADVAKLYNLGEGDFYDNTKANLFDSSPIPAFEGMAIPGYDFGVRETPTAETLLKQAKGLVFPRAVRQAA